MCRMMLVKSRTKIYPGKLLRQFAKMCQQSRTLEGYQHGDGWGVAWSLPSSLSQTKWQAYHSLKPIWNDQEAFEQFPETQIFLAHARSASFPDQRNILEYNQPFIQGRHGYVFNGMLKGVVLPTSVSGQIGSQKIWSMLLTNLSGSRPAEALAALYAFLKSNTRMIKGCNIGYSDGQSLYALSGASVDSGHFRLQKYCSDNLKIICSEPLGSYPMAGLGLEEVLTL